MKTIMRYIQEDGKNFLPIETVPVVLETATIQECIAQTNEKQTRGVLVRQDARNYTLVPTVDLLSNMSRRTVKDVLDHENRLHVLPADVSTDQITKEFTSDLPIQAIAVEMNSRVIGIIVNDVESFLGPEVLSAPQYRCSKNHHIFHAPPPSSCPWDGSDIEPA